MRVSKPGLFTTWSALVGLLLVVVACGGSSGTSYVENGKPLTFPTMEPFTGADASFGPELLAGCPAAAKVIAAAGGVLGHKSIECPAVDTRGDPGDAVPALQKMVATTTNLMAVLGPSSDEASATAPLLEAAHIPMFSNNGQPIFDKSNLHYFWRLTPSDDYFGYAMALYAWDAGYRKAAMVFGNDVSSQGTVPTVMAGFQKLGGTIVINEAVALGQASYRSEVQQMVATNPDVIFNELDPQTAATFFGQLKQLHGLYPFISTNAEYTTWIQAVSGTVGASSLAPVYHTLQGTSTFSGPAYDQYNTNLLASSADVPNPSQWSQNYYTETGFDSVIISALAMLAAGTTDPKVWNDFITKVTTAGGGATVVNTFADGKAALAAGKKIDYEGASGAFSFNQWHNSSGGFEVLGYPTGNGSQPIIKTYTAGAVNKLIS